MKKSSILMVIFAILTLSVYSQEKPAVNSFVKKQKGFGVVDKDSTFSLKFQFRIQNRAAYYSVSDSDLTPDSFEFRVRRLRLKLEGFVVDPRLTYYIQLSFSRGDMDWRGPDNSTINNSPNIVRDAVIFYNPTKDLKLGFGQTKLPGNRQRVVSSGDQQFYDRSIVNSSFNIDRDFGFFAHLTKDHFALRGAITSGEGRNSLISPNNGLAYTGRLEWLPFGRFTDGNDYVEGDLAREQTPKLSLAATYSYNSQAVRQAGQLGNDLYEERSIKNYSFDALFKYKGWAWSSEYANRDATNPITVNESDATKTRLILAGHGYMTQLSYLFKNNFEIAGRFASVVPASSVYNDPNFPSINTKQMDQVELGVTKYLNGHRVKIQGALVYLNQTDLRTSQESSSGWGAVFQIELGI
ncbi:MAG: OprO/OprP family phosphate-selective porin [Cyclobacteriaceae bacterium]|nr:OprO/OprP family phosphate-selective porin [Cyclobacteriaceae bacterium]